MSERSERSKLTAKKPPKIGKNRPIPMLARMLPPVPRPPTPTLSATFVSDNNIPDGQFFPPGAEFVKSWKMLNSGNTAWPEDCHLVFVAGDRLAPFEGSPRQVKIGAVPPGAEVEVTSGEMKVSY